MSEQPTGESAQDPAQTFAELRAQVQSDLIRNDGVFSLVRSALEFDDADADLPEFGLDIHYSSVKEQDIPEIEGNPDDYFSLGLRIQAGASSQADEVRIHFSTYKYIQLGYISRDSARIALFDDVGRLHKANDGTFDKDNISPRRLDAANAWLRAHNSMIRASHTNPAMRIDDMTRTWTDEEPTYSVGM